MAQTAPLLHFLTQARRSFGLKARVQHLDLYVDEPDAFAAALIAAAPDTSGNRT